MNTHLNEAQTVNDPQPGMSYLLGYAGLIPFVFLTVALLLDSTSDSALQALNIYSFGILSFLCGSWWLARSIKPLQIWRVLISNLIFLAGFASYLWVSTYFPLIAALLFITVYLLEYYTPLVAAVSKQYHRLRLLLTVIVASCLVITFSVTTS